MDRISELLDDVAVNEKGNSHDERVYRWMVEATNRIQELEHRLETLSEKVWYPEGVDE